MYQSFYGLSDAPFELTHRNKFLFYSPAHRDALAHLDDALLVERPLTLLIGGPGLGKTTLLHEVSTPQRLPLVRCLCVKDPTLPPDELLRTLFAELNAGPRADTAAPTIEALRELLIEQRGGGMVTGLAIDEAESLADDTLAQLCVLAGLRNNGTPLLPLILAGNESLRARLKRPALLPLNADRAPSYELLPLDLVQTAAYILWRSAAAGASGGALFTREAVVLVHFYSRGIPRMVSVICDNALMNGFARRIKPVSRDVIVEVCQQLDIAAPPPTAATPAARGPRFGTSAASL